MLANDVLWLLIVRQQLVDQFLIDRLLIRSLLASLIDSHFILLIGNFNGCLHTSFYTLFAFGLSSPMPLANSILVGSTVTKIRVCRLYIASNSSSNVCFCAKSA